MSRVDLTSLVGGIALAIIGILLLLDSLDELHLTAGWAASLFLAGAGATLLASGIRDES